MTLRTDSKLSPILEPRSEGDWPAAWVMVTTFPASSFRPAMREVTTALPVASLVSVEEMSTLALSDWARLRWAKGARIASTG